MRAEAPGGVGRRVLWFVGLWAAGVLVVSVASLVLRWVLMAHP